MTLIVKGNRLYKSFRALLKRPLKPHLYFTISKQSQHSRQNVMFFTILELRLTYFYFHIETMSNDNILEQISKTSQHLQHHEV